MLAAVAAIVIDLGGEPQSGVEDSALLIGLGAVAAAIITAVAAQMRLRATLKGERDRLSDQLVHDRQMRDLDDLRLRFDTATEVAESAFRFLVGAFGELQGGGDTTAAVEKLNGAAEASIALAVQVQRGWNRLGFETGLPEALEEWRLQLDEMADMLGDVAAGTSVLDEDRWKEQLQMSARAQRKYIDALRNLLGSQLEPV